MARALRYVALTVGLVAVVVAVPTPAFAATGVSPASGGTSMTAANAGPTATYAQLGDIEIDEGNSGEISLGRLAIKVPAGFEFSTSSLSISNDGSGSGSKARASASASCSGSTTGSISVTPTAGAITFYVCTTSSGTSDTTFTVNNPRVRPTANFPVARGNLYLDNTAGAVTIVGVTGGPTGTNFGSLVQNPGATTQLGVSLPASVTAGVAQTATVTAKDVYGNTAPAYRGAIRFTSTDPAATLPADYTFTAADNGVHAFTTVTLRTAGGRSVTATDKASSSINGVAATTVTPAAAASMTLTGIANPTGAGAATSATVTARDAFNNVATGYAGTVHFTSTDAAATLPSDHTFTPADAGTRTFTGLVLRTAGNQGVSVGDGTRSATQSPITVQPGALHHLALSPSSATTAAGSSRLYTAQGRDASENNLGDVTSATTFTIGPDGTCVGRSCSATAAGPHTVTGTNGAATGSASMLVEPATPLVSVELSPSTIVADGNSTASVLVTVADQYGNPRAGDPVDLSTDGDAQLSDIVDNGDGTYAATITASTVAGTQTITATDGAEAGSAVLTQVAGPASQVTLVLTPDSVEADGTSTTEVLITVFDAHGNPREGDLVTLATDGDVAISEVIEFGFGAYAATVTASTTPGPETLTATSGTASATAQLLELGPLSVGGVGPAVRGQGADGGAWGQIITINGSGFTPGASADFGPGVTVKFTTYVDATSLRAHIAVASDAVVGSRSVTVTTYDERSATCVDCFSVTSGPSVTSVSPNEIGPGTQRTVIISGANLLPGLKVAIPGSGVAVTSVSLIDSGHVSVGLSTAYAAAAGPRNLVITNPADGGSTVCSGCLLVTVGPVVSDISPSVLGGGALATVTVTGENFVAGARVSFAGSGVAVMSQSVIDDTHLVATLSIAGAAGAGARTVSVINPDGGRGTCATCFSVSAAPTATGITPNSMVRGTTAEVTITGTNFAPGASVSLGTGTTVSGVVVVNATTITATVSVSATTGAGSRTVLVTNQDQGRGTCVRCFTVAA